jgi:hypothetical protein
MPVIATGIVAVIVIVPVIVAVHLNGNAPVRVIETVQYLVQDANTDPNTDPDPDRSRPRGAFTFTFTATIRGSTT